MYEVEYLYEQLKRQIVEQSYINVLNTVTESTYDIDQVEQSISETVKMIEEASNKKLQNLFDKFKASFATAEKIIKNYKDSALKCDPARLEYKNYKVFMSDVEISNLHKKAIAYLNKFDPSKASESECKKYIMDSQNNVQYKEISKIFGDGKEIFDINKIVVTKTHDKEISKKDISEAVKYLEEHEKRVKKFFEDQMKMNNDYTNYVRHNSGLATTSTKGDIEKLRKNALNHKISLINIADSTYYAFIQFKMNQEFAQNKHIVVKAASYKANVKEAASFQDYIDAMYEFYENTDFDEASNLLDKRNKNIVTPAKLLNKHIKKDIVTNEEKEDDFEES